MCVYAYIYVSLRLDNDFFSDVWGRLWCLQFRMKVLKPVVRSKRFQAARLHPTTSSGKGYIGLNEMPIRC